MVNGAAAVQLLASATQGVDVQPQIATTGAAYTPGASEVIAVGRYSANPGEVTPEPALANGFYDVYFAQPTPVAAATQVLIKLYNTAITEDTAVMVWSDLAGTWAAASNQGINTFGGFAWVTVTGTSVPSILNLACTPFALVAPAAVEAPPAAPAILTPVFGDDSAPLKPTFTWTASEGATSYEFVLAEEIGQDNLFAIIDYSATCPSHGHVARETLKYNTVYNWRVRAVSDIGAGAWTTAFFTTMVEPEPEAPPVEPVKIIQQAPAATPEIILQIPPAEVQQVQVIPDVLLWVVVAVGAILIIAVIALIVRTRRVA
jgi:hypothetical protein